MKYILEIQKIYKSSEYDRIVIIPIECDSYKLINGNNDNNSILITLENIIFVESFGLNIGDYFIPPNKYIVFITNNIEKSYPISADPFFKLYELNEEGERIQPPIEQQG